MSPFSEKSHPTEDDLAEVILAQASELPADRRAAFVAEACGADAELQAEVDGLLADLEKAGSFLSAEAPATRELEAEFGGPAPERPGEWIGPYKLMEQIGEGGFGVVWVAEQENPVRRRVALKIIKPGMDSREVIARFEQERQALALMEHPNIARVLDAGATTLGRPYFVMELVHGVKITQYCDEAGLPTAERLRLFVAVCHAVQHAHQKGIIHRDLKPSNILVTLHDGVPVPKVIDFGDAKATRQRLTDLTIYTQFANMVGTPLYMSPEQAEISGLDVDTRSDIYSLGVLLYELLAGHTPFDPATLMKRGLDEIRRIVREEVPPKPSTFISTLTLDQRTSLARQRHTDSAKLFGQIRGDLDWIVMKALEKDRNRRYETATSFAQDIQRHLASEPVEARPPSAGYRFRRLIRRNKAAFLAGTAVFAALLCGLGVSTWMFFKEKHARERAVVAEQEQARERKKAGTAAYRSDQIAMFLKEMLAGISPTAARGKDTELLREILDNTTARLGNDLKDQPEVEAELGIVIGKIYGALGEYEKGSTILGRALEITTQLHGSEHGQVATLLNEQAQLLGAQGRLKEAEPMFREALAMQRRLREEDVTAVLNNLSLTLSELGRYGESETLLREALALNRKLKGDDHEDVVTELGNLGALLEEQGRFDEAEPVLREALTLAKKISGDDDPHVATILNTLANLTQKQNKIEESEGLFRELLALQRKLLKDTHPNVAAALNGLGLALHKQGKNDEAEPLLREGVKIEKAARTDPHPQTARLVGNLGRILEGRNKPADAEACYREALAIYCQLPGDEHPDVVSWRNRLGNNLEAQRKWPELETLYRDTLAIERKRLGENDPEVGTTIGILATVLEQQEKLGEAEKIYREALKVQRKAPGGAHPELDTTLHNFALLLHGKNRSAEAEPLMREAVAISRQRLKSGDPELAESVGALGRILERQHKYAEAVDSFREAFDLTKKSSGAGINSWHMRLERVLEKQENLADLEAFRSEALKEARTLQPPNPIYLEARLAAMAATLHRQSRFAEAEPLLREAVESSMTRRGPDHIDLIAPVALLARLLADWAWSARGDGPQTGTAVAKAIERAREAEQFARRCLKMTPPDTTKASGNSDAVRICLASVILTAAAMDPALSEDDRSAKFSEAEALLLECYDDLQGNPRIERALKNEALNRIVQLYKAWGRPDKTAEWQAKQAAFAKASAEKSGDIETKTP